MAKRMKSKIQPAVMTMNFVIEPRGDSKESFFLDISQCASIINRRFYRQGLNWAVSGFKFLSDSGATGSIQIQKLPNTWVMSNAWEKSFRAWQQMNKDALTEVPSVKPKFLDFKIYANIDHHVSGYVNNILPVSGATIANSIQSATAGEWESSKLRIPVGPANPGETTDRELIAVGASYPGNGASGINAVSIIEGYAASRGLPNILDPNTPTDADDAIGTTPQNWMSALMSEGTEQDQAVISDMITENNIAPYPFENDGLHFDTMYPGGANQLNSLEIHDNEFITSTTIGGTTRLRGGNFPCGLVSINLGSYTGSTLFVQVDLVPGTHRGYLCEPMTEM